MAFQRTQLFGDAGGRLVVRRSKEGGSLLPKAASGASCRTGASGKGSKGLDMTRSPSPPATTAICAQPSSAGRLWTTDAARYWTNTQTGADCRLATPGPVSFFRSSRCAWTPKKLLEGSSAAGLFIDRPRRGFSSASFDPALSDCASGSDRPCVQCPYGTIVHQEAQARCSCATRKDHSDCLVWQSKGASVNPGRGLRAPQRWAQGFRARD